MKNFSKKIISIILVLTIGIPYYLIELPKKAPVQAIDVTSSFEVLGNPFNGSIDATYSKVAYARNVWDMQRVGTKIYFGHGNSASSDTTWAGKSGPSGAQNAGPIALWYYQTNSGAVDAGFNRENTLSGVSAPLVSEEQIDTMRYIDTDGNGAKLVFAGHDPVGGATEDIHFYRLETGGLTLYSSTSPTSGILHGFDIYKFGSEIFTVSGATDNSIRKVTSPAGNSSWSTALSGSRRTYQLFEVGGNLYAQGELVNALQGTTVVKYNTGTGVFDSLVRADTESFFAYGTVVTCGTRNGLGNCQGIPRIVRPVVFGSNTLYIVARPVNDEQWVPFDGGLMKASGTVGSSNPPTQITGGGLPTNEDWKPWDILVDGSTVYVLGSYPSGTGNDQVITVHSSTDLSTWTEVFRLTYTSFARSFEKTPNGDFYLGIGSHWEDWTGMTQAPPLPAGDPESLPISTAEATTGNILLVTASDYSGGGSNSSPSAPSSLGGSSMVNGSFTNNSTPTLSFTLADSDSADTVKYQIQIDDSSNFSSPVVDYTSALASQGSASFTVGQAAGSGTYTTGSSGQTLADNSYYWRVKTIDNSNAQSSYSVANSGAVAYRVDTVNPSAPSSVTSSSHTASTWSNDATIDVSWSGSDANSGVAGYSYLFDTNSITTPDTNSEGTATSTTSLAQSTSNSIYFHVRAVDNAGNWGATTNLGPFYIDVTNPSVPGTPSTTSPTTDNTPTWSWTASSDSGSNLTNPAYTVQWSQNASFGSGISSSTINTNTFTHSVSLADGTWYFRAQASDNSGNTSSYSSNGTVLIDSSAPLMSNVTSVPSNSGATITWTTDEVSSSQVEYGTNITYGVTTTETDTSPRVISHSVTLTNLVACTTYNYRVRSKDSLLNTGVGSNQTFTTTGCPGATTIISQNAASITTSSGGSVSLTESGTGITLTVPSAFAANDADFQIKQLAKTAVLQSLSTPTNYSLVNNYLYQLQALPDTTTTTSNFNNAITVTISYAGSDITGLNPSTLVIYHYSGGNWSALSACSTNTSLRTVSCTTTSFSVFGLFGQALASIPATSSTPQQSDSSGASISSSSSCTERTPTLTPDLFQIISGANSARLYFTPLNQGITGYTISYDLTPEAKQYSVQMKTNLKGLTYYAYGKAASFDKIILSKNSLFL